MEKPKAILFDLCDTLYLFDPSRFSRIQVGGKEVFSTLGLVHEVLSQSASIPFETFHAVFAQTSQEIDRLRGKEHREVSSEEKFGVILKRLGLGPEQVPSSLLGEMVSAHMNALASALVLPPAHLKLLQSLKGRYRLGIVSNFDHSPTVYDLLAREGLQAYFDTVVISAEVGWRKPRPEIFQQALERLSLEAKEVLFVGDNPLMDVGGAQEVGMPVFWFNRHGENISEGSVQAQGVLDRLEDLEKNLL